MPAWPRLILILTAAAAIAYIVVRYILGPALAKLSLGDVAGRLERAFPQFDDRLRSTIDFSRGSPDYGSDVMQQRVMSETADLASRLDLNRAVVIRPVWYSTSAGIGAIALAARRRGQPAAPDVGVESRQVFVSLLVNLGRIEVAERIGWKVSDGAHRPVHVLQDAVGVIRGSQP